MDGRSSLPLMLTPLDLKLFRDLGRMKGQIVAVSLVMACGLAMMIMTRSIILTLETTRDAYYQRNRMADVFGMLKRAPKSLAERIALLPGVAAVEARVVVNAMLDIPGVDEPATARILSLPEDRPVQLNQLFIRKGGLPRPDARDEAVVSESFAIANKLSVGDRLVAVINGRREELRLCGIALSPEFVFEARRGETLPDNKRFGIFWMNERSIAVPFNLDGAFNDLCIDLSPGAAAEPVIQELDRMLEPFGGQGSYTRADHASAKRLDDELKVIRVLSLAYPVVFLSVAAFMVNAVLSRLVRLQREQIAQMKALGYTSWQVGRHYLGYALVIVVIGTVIGGLVGRWFGGKLLGVYDLFFRFPSLVFQMDYSAWGIALLVSAAASVLGVLSTVLMAVRLPPAEAMRPEPPADFKPSLLERAGLTRLLGTGMRMALRNIERRPVQAIFTVAGLGLATGLMVLPGSLADSIDHLLTYQWNEVQRQDALVYLLEPAAAPSIHDLEHLPGVRRAEPLRNVFVKISRGHQSRKLAITGMPRGGELNRMIDAKGRVLSAPEDGILMSEQLGRILDVRVGESVEVEALEGSRARRSVPVRGFIEDFAGIVSYMDIDALRQLLNEGETINGGFLTVDMARWSDFMAEVKQLPRAAITLVKADQLAAFRDTTGRSIGILRSLYFTLATIVAFGVVYNSARIALSERGRDLATLRVVGFSQREIASVLLGELTLLVLAALPVGLLFGRGLATFIITQLRTETVRLPLVISAHTYAVSVLVVGIASAASFFVVARMLRKLDMIAVLKARD